MTFVSALLVAALLMAPALLRTPPVATKVGLAGGAAQTLTPELDRAAAKACVKLQLSKVASAANPRAQVLGGRLDAVLELSDATVSVTVARSLPPDVEALVREVVTTARERRLLAAANVPPDVVRSVMAPVDITVHALEAQPAVSATRVVAAIVSGYLLLYAIIAYAVGVATGVAQEKTSRTAEVLLSAVRPDRLMVGKVIGIGVAGLGQVAIAVVTGLVANALAGAPGIPRAVVELLPGLLLWFLLGYALYAFVSAAAGAMVARQEEVQSATAPITVTLTAALAFVVGVVHAPDSWWVTLASLVAPFTPIVMPARLAMGPVPAWQLVLAIGELLAVTFIVARGAGSVYAASVMRGGPRVGWRAALRQARE
jgi:ABC-2 type transport system permease protein